MRRMVACVAASHRISGLLCGTAALPHPFQKLRTVRYEELVVMPDFAPERVRVVRFRATKPLEPWKSDDL